MIKDIIITLNARTKKSKINRTILGYVGENLQGNFIVDFDGEFIDGVCWLETACETEKGYIAMEKQGNNTYTLPIKSSLTKTAGVRSFQIRITQTEVADEIPIFKSDIFKLPVYESINATEEATEEYPEWIEVANSKLAEVNTAVERANTISADLEEKVASDYYRGETGPQGPKGDTPTDYIPNTRKINNKTLEQDINLTAEDVGAISSEQQEVINNKLDGKLDKQSKTHNYAALLYGVSNTGENQMFNCATTTGGYTVPYRLSKGELRVGEPTEDNHATTKKYVDTKIAELGNSAPEIIAGENISIDKDGNTITINSTAGGVSEEVVDNKIANATNGLATDVTALETRVTATENKNASLETNKQDKSTAMNTSSFQVIEGRKTYRNGIGIGLQVDQPWIITADTGSFRIHKAEDPNTTGEYASKSPSLRIDSTGKITSANSAGAERTIAFTSDIPKLVTLTQAEYDALSTKDANTYYFIKEE